MRREKTYPENLMALYTEVRGFLEEGEICTATGLITAPL